MDAVTIREGLAEQLRFRVAVEPLYPEVQLRANDELPSRCWIERPTSIGHRRDRFLNAIHQHVDVFAALLANRVEPTRGLFGERLAPASGTVG